jgi:mannose-6-phosphate isomerase-like protein (cupin superfamily)
MHKINLQEKFAKFNDQWSPKIIARLNGQYVKLAKVQGKFIWHHHETEHELFLVVKGQLTIQFRDYEETLNEGELIVVPAGVEHRPMAKEECWILLLEPWSTLNTGNVEDERTRKDLDWI